MIKSLPRPTPGFAAPTVARRRLEVKLSSRKWYRFRTAIIGESLAGLFVLETFFLEPGLFDIYIALSPSLYWNDMALVRGAGERLKALHSPEITLYFATAADDDIDDAGNKLAEALRTHAPSSLKWHYEPRPDLLHSTIYRGASPGLLRKILGPRAD